MKNNDNKASECFMGVFNRNNGLNPVDLDTLEYSVGNTQRSDYEFAKQIRGAVAFRDKMEGSQTADNLLDGLDVLMKAKRVSVESDPFDDYINSKTPKSDYYVIKDSSADDHGDDGNDEHDSDDVADEKGDIETEEKENADDITSDPNKKSPLEEFHENLEKDFVEIREEEDGIEEEFEENAWDITDDDDDDHYGS